MEPKSASELECVREYHLAELRIARSQDDPCRAVPEILPEYKHVLDVGCGAGQILIASNFSAGTVACGIDVDVNALQLGKEITDKVHFVCASGEVQPFRDGYFDFVFSRVALPLMHVPSALVEIARVLRPGGRVWFTLHPFAMTWKQITESAKSRNPKNLIFRFYVAVNGAIFHLSGKQLRFPVTGRCESFQTSSGIKRALHRAGFRDVQVRRNLHFLVTATRS